MIRLGIICLVVFVALCVLGWIWWMKKKREIDQKRIDELNVARDTARIIEEHKREEIAKTWEEFDQQEWQKRFEA